MSATNEITNSDDVIDSRDIEGRIDYLESSRDDFQTKEEWNESEEKTELESLISLRDDLEGYCDDWKYGVTLIRDSYFTEYAEELCKDIGELPKELPWYIANHIDWEGVAEEIKVDYTSAEFDGVTYWAR